MTYEEAQEIAWLIYATATLQVGNDPGAVALDMAVAALADQSVMDALFITAKVRSPARRRTLRSVKKSAA